MAHRRPFIGAGAAALATGMLIALPAFSVGAPANNDLRSFQAVSPRAAAATNITTQPALHGANPHGQGTAAVVDLNPSAARPFSADPTGQPDNEDIVIGRSRGERRADTGAYHGHVTVAALFGNELIPGADTGPTSTPVDTDIFQPLLAALCTAGVPPPGGGANVGAGICLNGVRVKSTTTATSSQNSFTLLSATIGGVAGLPATAAVNVGAASSAGNISSTASCQSTDGASQVANAALGAVTATLSTSASSSQACTGQAPLQGNDSSVVTLGASGLPITAPGCANGTADTVTPLLLITVVCNADDSSNPPTLAAQRQTDAPYGVRNALDVYVGVVGNAALLQLSTAQAESHAVAPVAVTPPPTTTTPTTTTPTTATPTTATPVVTPPAVAPTTPVADTGTTDDTGNAGDNGSGNGADNGSGNGGGTQCADGADNDGDGVIDAADPGCHSDGNAGNPASYNPNDDSEANGGASLNGNQLPFTGTDVVVLGLAGSILLAAGLALRGPARRRELDA